MRFARPRSFVCGRALTLRRTSRLEDAGGGARRQQSPHESAQRDAYRRKPPGESLSTPRIVLGEGQREFLAGRRVSLRTSLKQCCILIVAARQAEPHYVK